MFDWRVAFGLMGVFWCVSCDEWPWPSPPEPQSALVCSDACGPVTECARPTYDPVSDSCEPGLLSGPIPDPDPGDCQRVVCTGQDVMGVLEPDDGDVPAVQAPCAVSSCEDGNRVTEQRVRGEACSDGSGVCDGAGTSAVHCVRCVDDAGGLEVDTGCTVASPQCDVDGGSCLSATRWDPSWSPSGTYADHNLTVSNDQPDTVLARSTLGVSKGAYYWEIEAVGGDGATNGGGIGLIEATTPNTAAWVGSEASGLSWGYGSCCYNQYWTTWSGVSLPNGTPPLGSAVDTGIVYMFALDMDTGDFWAGQDGTWYNNGDPVTGINPAATGLSGTVHAGVTLYRESIDVFQARFAPPFVHAAPKGFQAGLY